MRVREHPLSRSGIHVFSDASLGRALDGESSLDG